MGLIFISANGISAHHAQEMILEESAWRIWLDKEADWDKVYTRGDLMSGLASRLKRVVKGPLKNGQA